MKDIDNKFKGAQSAVKDELTLLKAAGVAVEVPSVRWADRCCLAQVMT